MQEKNIASFVLDVKLQQKGIRPVPGLFEFKTKSVSQPPSQCNPSSHLSVLEAVNPKEKPTLTKGESCQWVCKTGG